VYEYRVQSWGGHGPSAWANVTGCMMEAVGGQEVAPKKGSKGVEANFMLGSGRSDESHRAPGSAAAWKDAGRMKAPRPAPFPSAAVTTVAAAAASLCCCNCRWGESANGGTVLDYMWSVNGAILLLGCCRSRSSITMWRQPLQLLFKSASLESSHPGCQLPATSTQSPVGTWLVHALSYFILALQACGWAFLGALGFVSPSEGGREREPGFRSHKQPAKQLFIIRGLKSAIGPEIEGL